jgi:hypothetical protein
LQAFITYMKKDKDPDLELDPDPYLRLMDTDPGGPKICGSGSGSGSPALLPAALKKDEF